jgi:hypothetical protein
MMHSLMDITNGQRVLLENLDLDQGQPIACVMIGDDLIQLTPPSIGTNHLAFLFLNGRESKRFILIDDLRGEWLCDDGSVLTSEELADLPLRVAAQHSPLTPERLRGFDS